jgi:hypothetical protein
MLAVVTLTTISFFHVSTNPKVLRWCDLARRPLGGVVEDLFVNYCLPGQMVCMSWLEPGGGSSHGWLEFDPVIH